MRTHLALTFLTSLTLAACVTTQADRRDVYARVLAEMDRCADAHGYRRAEYLALGPHELAPGEIAWRACVHAGIERVLIPAALEPEAYRAFIQADRELTQGIAEGRVTRAERETRLGDMLAGIEAEEERARQAKLQREIEARRAVEEQQRLMDEMRRIQQNASEMRQRLRAR